jgi:hypothetical protein
VFNEIGGSLIMVMITGVVIASGGAYFMKKHSVDLVAVKSEQVIFEIEVLTTRMIDQLSEDRACRNTIGGSDIRTKLIDEVRNFSNMVVFNTADNSLHGNIFLNSFEIEGEFLPATNTYKSIEDSFGTSPIPPGEFRYGELNIILNVEKKPRRIFGAREIRKTFSIIAKVDENYMVQSCYNNFKDLTKKTRKQFCSDLGGLFNFNTGCNLKGGTGIGIKVKEANCEMLGGSYDVLSGRCDGSDLYASCADGEYMEGFNFSTKVHSCVALPVTK